MREKFESQVRKFFGKYEVDMNPFGSGLMDFLFERFQKRRGPFKSEQFKITLPFMKQSLGIFLKDTKTDVDSLFIKTRPKRENAKYKEPEKEETGSQPVYSKHARLIRLLGTKKSAKLKLTQPDGASLPSPELDNLSKHLSVPVSFSPLASLQTADNRKAVRPLAVAKDETIYERDLVTSSGVALWRESTLEPKKLSFNPARSRRSSFDDSRKGTKEHFQYTVTKQDVLDRLRVGRPVTQTGVMGISADNAMKAIGAVINKKQGKTFNWAHRRAWSLNGDQDVSNLDITTTGSNYDTLFKVEEPLRKLLFENGVNVVLVNGTIVFDDKMGLPEKIIYRLSWGTTSTIEVVIDPMDHRVPSVDEYEIASSLFAEASQSSTDASFHPEALLPIFEPEMISETAVGAKEIEAAPMLTPIIQPNLPSLRTQFSSPLFFSPTTAAGSSSKVTSIEIDTDATTQTFLYSPNRGTSSSFV